MTWYKRIRYIPILIILTLLLIFYFTGVLDYLSFEQIKKNRDWLKEGVQAHPYIAPLLYIIFYIIITTLSVPVDVFLAMLGGFLFPQPYCTIFACIGAAIGANFLFLATRTAFGNFLKERASPFIIKIESGFQENASYYLLFLRLVPIFPFWLVNITPAFLGIPFSTFAWTTILGIIPAAFAFTEAGTGLGEIFDSGQQITMNTILNHEMKIALVALGAFALIPVIIKSFWPNSNEESGL